MSGSHSADQGAADDHPVGCCRDALGLGRRADPKADGQRQFAGRTYAGDKRFQFGRQVIARRVPERYVEVNMAAFEAGRQAAS